MKGTALIYHPAAVEPEIRELSAPPSLELLKGAVGGYIEIVPHWDRVNFEDAMHRCVAFCNEDGKRMGLPLNIPAMRLWHAAAAAARPDRAGWSDGRRAGRRGYRRVRRCGVHGSAVNRSKGDIAGELADNLTPYPGKACGGCTACCSTLAVRELNLPNWTRCPHVRTPPDAVTGCSIYATRPPSCRAWICGWRATDWEDDCRPDRCGVIVDPMPDLVWVNGESLAVARLWVLRGHEESYRHDPVQALILAILATGNGVLWDMAPNQEGQRLAQVIRRSAAGQVEMSYPTPVTKDTGMSEAERSFRAMGWDA